MSIVQTILIKTKDPDIADLASRALNKSEGYRLIYCEDDRSAIRRLDEIHVN